MARKKLKVPLKNNMVPKDLGNSINGSQSELPIISLSNEKKCRSNAKDELEEMYISMINVLNTVKSHDDSGPFLNPVEEDFAPGYFNIIKEPMDISTMELKILQRVYKSRKQFEKDFRKMVNNCEVFNGVGNAYTNMAYSIWRVFTKSMKNHFAKRTKLKTLQDSTNGELRSAEKPKLYVCSRKTVDGAIKITIKQTEKPQTRVVPPTTIKVGGKSSSFEIKKDNVQDDSNPPINICIKKSYLNQNIIENNITEQPSPRKINTSLSKPVPASRLPVNRRRKKKKKPAGMKALEMLAQAAERAIKDAASFDDDTFSSHSNSPIYNAFPDLKISTTQSHPADVLHRLYSKTQSGLSTPEKLETVIKDSSASKMNENANGEFNNDITDIFPCAAATLVFPRYNCSNSRIMDYKTDSPDSGIFEVSRPIKTKSHSRTQFSDSEDSSAFGSDCSDDDDDDDDLESLNGKPKFPEIKPCQVTLSRLSPRLYYKGNKVRILEQVKREKKKLKRRKSRRHSLQSNEGMFLPNVRDKEETETPTSVFATTIKEYATSHEIKPLLKSEVSDETNFLQQWGKNNVPPRKRFSSLFDTDAERKLFCDNNSQDESVTQNNNHKMENISEGVVPQKLNALESVQTKDTPIFSSQTDSESLIDVENVKEEPLSPAKTKTSLNTDQFESITDSESDEGYTTNERSTPVFKSNDKWFNSLTSKFIGLGDSFTRFPSQYPPRPNDYNHQLQFGMIPYGNGDLPNEKNGVSFEAQCHRENNYVAPPPKPSYIDFTMLTPLTLNRQNQNPYLRQVNNPSSFYLGHGFPNSNSGLIENSGSILNNPFHYQGTDHTLPYESVFQHSSQ